MSPVSSSRAAARRFLSFTFTRIDVLRRALNVFMNADIGTTTCVSKLNRPRNVPILL